ncbi:MAG TPA: NAD(P)H-binding protein [Acidimicrobiales bacterium]|nr:NAD(P)H-binding protein [Acidimicrobiales bacterium]
MILVAGGTGRLGSLVVHDLVARGLDVRVLTRDPARAAHLKGVATEVVTGDVRDRASLDASMAGVTTVVSAVQGFAGPGRGSPASVDNRGNANLVDAASSVGADVVLVSVVGASGDHPMELFRAKHEAEEHLRTSGRPWTIVRATAFVELWAEILAKGIIFGRGDNPINFVAVADVAAVVVRATVDQELRGQVLEVGGPEDLTFNELAGIVRESRNGPKTFRHIPRWVLRAMSPVSRQPRAALVMDRIDLRFDAHAAEGNRLLAKTDVRTALGSARETA